MVIDGKTIIVKTGRMAKQAHGAVEVYCGDTMVLVTCTESRNVRDGIDYFPTTSGLRRKNFIA
jgi:polyribonucleotide nucleotidyltransferase